MKTENETIYNIFFFFRIEVQHPSRKPTASKQKPSTSTTAARGSDEEDARLVE